MSRANNYEGGVHGFRFQCARQQTAMCALFLAATGFARDEEIPGEVSRNNAKPSRENIGESEVLNHIYGQYDLAQACFLALRRYCNVRSTGMPQL